MSPELSLYLTEQVMKLYDLANHTGDKGYARLAHELNEVLNGCLEMQRCRNDRV